MCLAVPGRIETIDGTQAQIAVGGARVHARLDLVDAAVGDYVLVHAGFAIARLDETEALETLALLQEASARARE